MNRRFRRPLAISAIIVATLLAACGVVQDAQSVGTPHPAALGAITSQNRALRSVPLPDQRITVSIYDLPDLTGQYKASSTGQTLSRAVTQGGAAILVKGLQDAGERRWFRVLDRSALDNLLRERQIVTEMRRIYREEENIDAGVLGPLAHSGLLIEGAVIGYDTNTLTGGYGARYLGIGGDRKWKLDTVTVNLRLLSSESGEVLASVVVRKPIASISERGSIFTYIALDQILEGELGRATNEPKQIALEQAVEKAVMALIAEGAMAGVWGFEDETEGKRFVAQYLTAKFDGDVTARASKPLRTTTPGALSIPATRPAKAKTTAPDSEHAATPAQPAEPAGLKLPPNGPQPGEVLG